MNTMDSYIDARLNQGKIRDHIYIHMSAINDSYTNNMNLQLQYSRDEPFINNPFLYKCAISKLTIDTFGGSMPLMLPKMLIGLDENGNTNTNPSDALVYTVGSLAFASLGLTSAEKIFKKPTIDSNENGESK